MHINSELPLALPTRPAVLVTASRALSAADHAQRLELGANVTLTLPDTLPDGFEVAVDVPAGYTATVTPSGTATANGSTASLTRTVPFAIWRRVGTAAHTVTGF